MGADRHKVQKKTGPTRLELLLRLEGDFRKRLGPIGVTPSQAGVILFLRCHADANVTDAATALGVSQPTLSRTVTTLVGEDQAGGTGEGSGAGLWLFCVDRPLVPLPSQATGITRSD